MLILADVTLICVDDNFRRGSRAVMKCLDYVEPEDVRVLSHGAQNPRDVIGCLGSLEKYSAFVLRRLHEFFTTKFCLVVQYDGYILNPKAWQGEFLEYDYVGAPWPDGTVGNGGFSLRSRRLTEATASPEFVTSHPWEDQDVCRIQREHLVSKGIRFAPTELAARFSTEAKPWVDSFGYHGAPHVTPIPKEHQLRLDQGELSMNQPY